MLIGFSTGSLAKSDFRRGLEMAAGEHTRAVELSALREEELDPLLNALDSLRTELDSFDYVSIHAPSRLERLSEREFVSRLQAVANRGWPIVTHPDVIQDFELWRTLGDALCIENMDRRKRVGRTAAELERYFEALPDATFCFDVGHARQVDPTMQEAHTLADCFRERLRQIHLSYVNSQSRHERLNLGSRLAFRELFARLGSDVPVILETPVRRDQIKEEMAAAEDLFSMHGSSSWQNH